MATSKQLLRKEMGERLRAMRRVKNLSIDELAEKMRMTSSHLGLIERGERGITVERLIHACKFFDCSADFMLTGKEPGKAKGSTPAHSVDRLLGDKERQTLAELIYLLRA
jgi:transcriptional regulator with XRE-family HTH domain